MRIRVLSIEMINDSLEKRFKAQIERFLKEKNSKSFRQLVDEIGVGWNESDQTHTS